MNNEIKNLLLTLIWFCNMHNSCLLFYGTSIFLSVDQQVPLWLQMDFMAQSFTAF